DAAAAAHRFGGLREGAVDPRLAVDDFGNRVAHRLHETVDERRLQRDARCGIDAAGGDETVLERLVEALLPLRALRLGLDLGERAGDAQANLADRVRRGRFI